MTRIERRICASDVLIDGGDGVRFEVNREGLATPALAVRHQGRVFGYINRCGHVPVELDWQQGRFFDHSGLYLICATHGALYAVDSGRCLSGRCAGRGLTPLQVNERDDGIYISEGE